MAVAATPLQLAAVLALVALLQPAAAREAKAITSVLTPTQLLGSDLPSELKIGMAAGVLLSLGAIWVVTCTRKAADIPESNGQTPERLKSFTKWAEQQIESSPPGAHRQILDDVISTFATYAQRIEKGPSRNVRRAAEGRLRVLIDLLETPTVNATLRSMNWAWVREWDQQLLEHRDARLRCTVVFPTICTAHRLQVGGGAQTSSPRSLAYLAAWCTDFLNRQDVRDFLGISDSPARKDMHMDFGSGSINFMTPGALYSESSEDEDEDTPQAKNRGRGGYSPQAGEASSECRALTKRQVEGQEHCWDEPDATEVLVRGANYLEDRRKIHSRSSMLELVECDLVKTWDEMLYYTTDPRGKVKELRAAGDSRFFFIINFRLRPLQLCLVFAVPQDADWLAQPEGRTFQRFVEMSDEERGKRLKVLPKVLEGPWLVKKGVPSRPGVLGKKLAIDWYSQQDHLEASIDCISSPAGRRLVQLLTGAARHFSMELFFILEGQQADELPERILGGWSCSTGVQLGILPVR